MPIPVKPVTKIITPKNISPLQRAEPGSKANKPIYPNTPMRVVSASVATKIKTAPVPEEKEDFDTDDSGDDLEDIDLNEEILEDGMDKQPSAPVKASKPNPPEKVVEPPKPVASKPTPVPPPVKVKETMKTQPEPEETEEQALAFLSGIADKSEKAAKENPAEVPPTNKEEPKRTVLPEKEKLPNPLLDNTHLYQEQKPEKTYSFVANEPITEFMQQCLNIQQIPISDEIRKSLKMEPLRSPYKFWTKEFVQKMFSFRWEEINWQHTGIVPSYTLNGQKHEIWFSSIFIQEDGDTKFIMLDIVPSPQKTMYSPRQFSVFCAYTASVAILFLK